MTNICSRILTNLRNHAGWLITFIVVIILPLLLWVSQPAIIGEINSSLDLVVLLAKFAAFTALSSFSWSLVLGARLHFIDRLFSGLDKSYLIHRLVGSYSFGAIMIHATAITLVISTRSPETAVDIWLLKADIVSTLGVVSLIFLSGLLFSSLLLKLKYQTFIGLHRMLGLVLIPAGFHSFLASGQLAENIGLRWYLLILMTFGAVAYLYHSILGNWLIKKYPYSVISVVDLGAGISQVNLVPRFRPLTFMPGQFGYLSMESAGIETEAHPFSFSSDRHSRNLNFTIKNLGDYTAKIGTVRPGDWASVDGPYGGFNYQTCFNRRQIWIAGGIGITPFLSMTRSFTGRLKHNIDMFYCTKDYTEAVFKAELEDIATRHNNFKLHHICETNDGFLTVKTMQQLVIDFADADIFICGPPPMLHSLRQQFLAVGKADSQIHYEEFTWK